MKTYWEYTDKEKSQFTYEQIDGFVKFELMERGIEPPIPPVLNDIPDEPNLPEKKKYYAVCYTGKYNSSSTLDIFFLTQEDAMKFIGLDAVYSDYDYEIGSNYTYSSPISDLGVKEVEMYNKAVLASIEKELKIRAKLRSENESLTTNYNKQKQNADNASEDLHNDWEDKKEHDRSQKRLINSYNNYLETCESDSKITMNFLRKLYTVKQIKEAFKWCDVDIKIK